jgi:hypothetical protein
VACVNAIRQSIFNDPPDALNVQRPEGRSLADSDQEQQDFSVLEGYVAETNREVLKEVFWLVLQR